jgi:ATP-dependent DNA helicase RecG
VPIGELLERVMLLEGRASVASQRSGLTLQESCSTSWVPARDTRSADARRRPRVRGVCDVMTNFFASFSWNRTLSYPPFHPARPETRPLSMTEAEFAAAFPTESNYVERKTGVGGRTPGEVVAFSNSDGGVILIGVDDAGEIVGRTLTAGTEDEIHQRIREINNPGRYSIHELAVDGRTIIALAVARKAEGFAQTSDGRILVRRGTMSVALIGEELVRFVNERALTRFEDTDTGLPITDADPERLAELADAYGWTSEIEDRLGDYGFVDPTERTLTVAGALHLLSDPAQRLGKAFIEVLRFPSEGAEYDKRLEIHGALGRQLEDAVEQVTSELGNEFVVLGVRRYELPRIPRVVLREALANAIAHRSYELDGTAVRVEIYPGAVRIISPGGLPEPVTVENIRETQAARNLKVISALRRFGLAEDAGRGVDVMVDSMREELLEPPTFEDSGHAVTVLLAIRSAVTPMERAWIREIERRGLIEAGDRFLLVHGARGERLTNSRTRVILGIDAGEARKALQRLRDAGFLTQHGERGGASYTLTDTLEPPAGLRLSPGELAELVMADAHNPASPPLTNARVRALTGLDRVEALAVLENLVQAERHRRTGERRGTRYEPIDA